uniref:Peptidase M12B domain-containing protein n=1 Tax=Parascaris univalens TaxID=6257 RepID=A0A915C3N8_PARUN
MIFVPQLAVVEFKLQQPEDGKKQLEAHSKSSFFFSYDEQSNSGIFYKMFPKKGGRFVLENSEYIFKSPMLTRERPRVRLILAVPSDFDYLTVGNEFASLVRRIKLVALMAQSVFAASLRRRYGSGTDECLTFCFDSKWEPKTAEIPIEYRTFSGSDQLLLSGPFVLAGEEELPALAILKTNRASAELYGTRDMATYFIKCLELLGERNPLFLLNLIFIIPKISGNMASGVRERFEAKRDVCVISSPMLVSLPDTLSSINAALTCTAQLDVEHCRSLPRVVSYSVANGKCTVRHTIGGAIASLLGAVVHELGHLFKLPHTRAGIMNSGGDNVQVAFLVDKNINLALNEPHSLHEDINCSNYSTDRQRAFCKELVSKRISESLFDDVSLDLLHLSRFLAWNANVTIQAIRYERESRLLSSDAGIVRVAYITGCIEANIMSYLTYPCIKQLQLDAVSGARVLVVASDGRNCK